MSIQVKFRRGTTTQHNSFTGADGEITVDSTIKTLRVHDGATVGGIRLARYSEIGTATQYLQVANASALYTTKAYAAANSYVKSTLANTNSYIATKLNTTTFNSALANTNSYIVARASWSALTATNTAIRALVSDRLQVANATTLFATKVSWSGLTGTNTALRTLISDRLQVANAVVTYQTKSIERAALANTNLRINLINTNLTGTNTALRALISDRIQVANAVATYQTKSVERAALANTNLRITLVNTNLLSTNTSIRSYIDTKVAAVVNSAPGTLDTLRELANALGNNASFATATAALIGTKISVANAVATYLTKSNPIITGTLTANSSTGTDGYYLRTSSTGIYWSPVATQAAATATSQIFAGTGSQTIFTLSASVSQQRNVIITVNGILQIPVTHYTISGTTLTFTSAPYSGAVIEARNMEGVVISGGSGGTISSGDLFLGSMLLGGM
jgi:hypothetical protein